MDRRLVLSGTAAMAAAAYSRLAYSQQYPERPVKIVVAYPPGSGLDTVSRLTAERLGKRFNQPFVVENRAGAGGNIGSDFAFKATPDGYTLLVSPPSPLVINQPFIQS